MASQHLIPIFKKKRRRIQRRAILQFLFHLAEQNKATVNSAPTPDVIYSDFYELEMICCQNILQGC